MGEPASDTTTGAAAVAVRPCVFMRVERMIRRSGLGRPLAVAVAGSSRGAAGADAASRAELDRGHPLIWKQG
jgi:hypothetical protein